jgi:mRNA interferase RelE/StbE
MTVEPLRAVRDHLSEFVDRAEREHERVVVTRNGGGYGSRTAVEVVTEPYGLQVAAGAARTIQHKLPRGVAAAVIELITGSLLENPHGVGKALRYELDGVRSARRGAFRVLYEIDDVRREVIVLRVDHRADAYRAR